MTNGEAVRIMRGERTQKALADMMRAYGFKWSQATVWAVESNKRPVTLDEALRLEWLTGDDLLTGYGANDADHAAAIERERIAAWHESQATECANAAQRHTRDTNMYVAVREAQAVHEGSARKLRNGDHWKDNA